MISINPDLIETKNEKELVETKSLQSLIKR